MITNILKLDEGVKWQALTTACTVVGSKTSEAFNTGEWRVDMPEYIEDKCKQCLLCIPVCPDSSIPVKNEKRLDFDMAHCKGCGICARVCPFEAIIMKEGE